MCYNPIEKFIHPARDSLLVAPHLATLRLMFRHLLNQHCECPSNDAVAESLAESRFSEFLSDEMASDTFQLSLCSFFCTANDFLTSALSETIAAKTTSMVAAAIGGGVDGELRKKRRAWCSFWGLDFEAWLVRKWDSVSYWAALWAEEKWGRRQAGVWASCGLSPFAAGSRH
ncbi:hypothetical protein EV2_023424 [Malus domestica]